MFVNNYNPTYDDIFLYDNTNTGYPTGLNPNHELYPLREYLSAVCLRPRAWTNINPEYPSGPPGGTPLSQYPNYYNTANPLLWWIDEYNMGGCVHYMGTRPSDSFADFIKKTTLQDSNSKRFWSDYNFNSTTEYGPVYNIYNCVDSSGLTGATAYLIPHYFSGSPEITGYGSGNTYYQILSRDFGIIEQVPPKVKRTLKTLKTISITSLAELSGVTYNFGSSITLTSNLYFWDGQDRIVPAEVRIDCEIPNNSNGLNFNIEVSGSRIGYAYTGDSSSLILFKHNDALFIVAHITGGGSTPTGYAHNSYFYPINTYFVNNNVLKSNWVYTAETETVGATLGGINNITSLLQTTLTTAQAKLAELGS